MDRKHGEIKIRPDQKLAYHKPELIVYGSMRDLTKTGAGNRSGDHTSPYNTLTSS
jgi:hypothetical protein